MTTPGGYPARAVEDLVAARTPYLIGVRHHSPALAAAVPALLDAAAPDVVAVELPAEAQEWVEWLSHPEARAPLALALSREGDLSFYPFADFSPELVALRWARERGVPVVCIDLAVPAEERVEVDVPVPLDEGVPAGASPAGGSSAGGSPDEGVPDGDGGPGDHAGWWRHLAERARAGPSDHDEVWDRLVEAPAPGSTAEQIRRAALAYGWALRDDSGTVDATTNAREERMRRCLARELAAGYRVAAVVGAFHAPALLDVGAGRTESSDGEVLDADVAPVGEAPVRSCLVGYSFAQLDSRSGYPAGIRDPGWQQAVLRSGLDPAALTAAATEIVTQVTRALRADGHPAGPGEAAEVMRVASDLATLRGLRAPSRRELVEAVTSVLAQGDVVGRGRAVAAALEHVLVGRGAGAVAPGTPVSGLREALVEELRAAHLPVEGSQDLRLAPLRGGTDLDRHVLLRRLQVGGIVYATPVAGQQWRGADAVTERWALAWTAATDASIELAAARGLTAEQLATTTLLTRAVEVDDVPRLLGLLVDAADCGSSPATERALRLVAGTASSSDFGSAVALARVLADVASARVPGAALLPVGLRDRAAGLTAELTGAAVRELRGIAGSDRPEDASALAAFTVLAAERQFSVRHALHELLGSGSPLMQGAAAGLLVTTAGGHEAAAARDAPTVTQDADAVAPRIASWLGATTAEERRALRRRLAGLVITGGSHLETAPALTALVDRVNVLADPHFVSILPALRGGFDVLGQQARAALYTELGHRFGTVAELVLAPEEAVAAAQHDTEARRRLAALGLADLAFSPAERWRLVLGGAGGQSGSCYSGQGARMASALDELYGRPDAGSLDEGRGGGAGKDLSQLGVRQWREEIEALFGTPGVEEILGQAAEAGRADVLEQLDPERVRPSVELLATALSLAGALPEARLARLRPLVARLVRELAEQLAVRLRPALAGLTSAHPTRRHTGVLDLQRTIRANLRHVVELDGRPQVVPVHPVFRQPGRKEADWHVIVVVDVSGSMSESVVFSALTAAVLAGVPALRVSFLTFSTEVIDFSGRVSDPLSLLLEVRIGGGTDIAGALRAARSLVRVPTRTLCVVVSDFEEYGSTGPLVAEVEALHSSGVRLLGCAALDDSGNAVYNVGIAQQVAAAGMRVAAVSPLELARWVGRVVRS